MNHADVKSHLADYLEGELSLDQRALVDAHLDDCGECAREVDEMQRTIRLLRMLPEPVPPPMMAANVMRRIRAGESQPRFFERIGRIFGNALESSFVLPASAIAVASLVVTIAQNPHFLSNLDVAGLTGMLNASSIDSTESTESTAAIPIPFVGGLGGSDSTQGQIPVARVGRGQAYVPFTIQIGGVFPRQPSLTGVGRAPRVLETRATHVAGNANGAPFQIAPRALVPVEDFGRRAGGARQASQVQGYVQGDAFGDFRASSGGDPRDEWIAHALQSPIEFARYIGSRNLAEQELWVLRLSERAEDRGLMKDLVGALRASRDPTAAWVADDFAAQVSKVHGETSSAD